MTEVMTSEGRVSRADAARIHFAKHYAIMRKYHTQLTRIKNRTISKNNKTGRTGVWLDQEHNRYRAYITLHRKKIHLGCFEKYEDAVAAREKAEHEYLDPLIAAIDEEFGT